MADQEIKELVQQDSQKAMVTLFVIDAGRWGLGQLRFTADKGKDGENIMYNGNEYINLPIEADGFELTNQGTLPTPTLKFYIDDISIRSILIDSNDLLGAPVARIRIFEQHLDDGIDPDPQSTFPIDTYYIEQKISQTPYEIEFELKTLMDMQGTKLPKRRTNRRTCDRIYRQWDRVNEQFVYTNVDCPYTGNRYYDSKGNEVFNAEEDMCGKRIGDCKARFGENAELPGRFMPGLRKL